MYTYVPVYVHHIMYIHHIYINIENISNTPSKHSIYTLYTPYIHHCILYCMHAVLYSVCFIMGRSRAGFQPLLI